MLSSKIKAESLLNGHTRPSPPSLVSRLRSSFPSVIRSQACASWKKTATGDWQPTTGFMAVVSGGRRVSRMDGSRRDFTLPSCALTHSVLPLLCSRWLIFTAVCPRSSDGTAANKNRGNSAVQYYVNIIQNAVGYEFLLICRPFFVKLQVIKRSATVTCIPGFNTQPLHELTWPLYKVISGILLLHNTWVRNWIFPFVLVMF